MALRVQLALTEQERQLAEKERDRLLAEQNGLESASISIEDLLDLHFERAEFERRNRERVETETTSLTIRVKELERLLIAYQAQQVAPERTPEVKQIVNVVRRNNEDAIIHLILGENDFGQECVQPLAYSWYCQQCDLGGTEDYTLCPHCRNPSNRNHAKLVRFHLPSSPRYGRVITLAGQGYNDNPTARRSDLHIWVDKRRDRGAT